MLQALTNLSSDFGHKVTGVGTNPHGSGSLRRGASGEDVNYVAVRKRKQITVVTHMSHPCLYFSQAKVTPQIRKQKSQVRINHCESVAVSRQVMDVSLTSSKHHKFMEMTQRMGRSDQKIWRLTTMPVLTPFFREANRHLIPSNLYCSQSFADSGQSGLKTDAAGARVYGVIPRIKW